VYVLAVALAGLLVRGGAAQEPTGQPPVPELSFTTYLDKPAVWIGDQFHYQIIVDHPPTIRFVLENVSPEAIHLDPLRVVQATASTTSLKNGKARLFVDLTLVNFTTGVTEIQIPQLSLFYFRRDAATAELTSSEGVAAESLTVPGPIVAVRSMLPAGAAPELRDAVTVTGWPRSRWIVAGVGWCALVLLVFGVGWEGARLLRHRKDVKGHDPRASMAAVRARWSASVPADFADANTIADFYGRSYDDVKEYLGYLLETHTEGLTADEMQEEMNRRAVSPDLTERAVRVLSTCEIARYESNSKALVGDTAREVANEIRQIFQASKRT
jgi:hypothetical protein